MAFLSRFLNVLKCFRKVEGQVSEQSSNSITVFCSCAIMSISHLYLKMKFTLFCLFKKNQSIVGDLDLV